MKCTFINTYPILPKPLVLVVKNSPANAGDIRDVGLIPGSGRFPEEALGNLLQYSCMENPMDRGAWWDMVHRVAKSQTLLKNLSKYTPGMVKYKIHNKFKGKGRISF